MKTVAVVAIWTCVSLSVGCGGGGPDSSGAAASGGASQIQLPGTGGLGSGSGGKSSVGSSGTSAGPEGCLLEEDSTCVGESYEGETIPLDIYIMFDQSGSMCSCVDPAGSLLCPDPNCRKTRLDAVREATAEFLRDPKSVGIGVGISFFGKQPIGQANCQDAEYSEAAVGIQGLPQHADAIMSALQNVVPTGETPTGPALRGACEYASAWKRSSAHEVVILLLTDGRPEAPVTCTKPEAACCPTLDDAVEAARECYTGNPGVRTYVLGVGPLLKNLQDIAVAGGTQKAYLVEGGDVSNEVLRALNHIRGDAVIPCEFQLPEAPTGQTLNYDRVNLKYADAACQRTDFYYVENAAGCTESGGWYYDDRASPSSIQLCPTSCAQVSVPGGQFFYDVGCETRYAPR